MLQSPLPTRLDHGDPVDQSRSFRRCLGQFATGVAIITARSESGELGGVTVNSFSSVSLDPPLVLWSISRGSRSLETFLDAKRFAVNILAADQIAVSRHFSGSAEDKFADVETIEGRGGLPLISGAIAHFECRLETTYEGGDHVILLGRVEQFARYAGEALLFVQGQYGVASPHPDLVADNGGAKDDADARGEALRVDDLTAMIFDARNQLSARFSDHRAAEGVALAEGRVLRRVAEEPGIDRDSLLALTFLGERDLDDAIEAMKARSLIAETDGSFELTEGGRHRRNAIHERWRRFHAEQIAGIPTSDLEATLRVLKKIIGSK